MYFQGPVLPQYPHDQGYLQPHQRADYDEEKNVQKVIGRGKGKKRAQDQDRDPSRETQSYFYDDEIPQDPAGYESGQVGAESHGTQEKTDG